jgi:anaerobic magnesium-protoporphyrin IX monomethyl ester cyclase
MKVLLVTWIVDSFMIQPDLGLGYLATSLRKNGHDVNILDCSLLNLSLDGFKKKILELKPEVVGFKVFSKDVEGISKQVSIVHKELPESKILIGGCHPSGVLDEIFDDFPEADFAFIGEAENSFPAFLNYIDSKESYKNIPGLIYRNSDDNVHHTPQEFIEDLDALGFPAWDLIDPRIFPHATHGSLAKSFPIAPIIATRGCPYRCTFCAVKNTMGHKIRSHSVEYVLEEIGMLYKDYGIREFHFEDDTFTSKKDFVIKICEGIMSRNMKIFWSCPNGVRIDTLDDELLTVMKKSGCYAFSVGIESGSEKIRKHMKKKLDTKTIEEKVKLIRKHSINVHGFFILGYPEETREDMEMSFEFSRRIPFNTVYFNIFNPNPGSEIYEKLKAEGKLDGLDWSSLAGETPSISVGDICLDEIKKLHKKAMLRFYLRPRTAFEFLTRLTSLTQIKYLLKRASTILFSNR